MGNRGKIRINIEYNITLNRDFQSTELFIKNYNNYNYNSFILGNSRSFFYDISAWEKYIDGNSFHFNSSAESLFGIERKLNFLDKKNVKIKNVLIVLDYGTLCKTNNSRGHLFVKHPLISGESYFSFYKEMFKGFFPKPIIAYVDLFLTKKRKTYMSEFGIRENVWKINLISNQLSYFLYDSVLEKDIHKYYKGKEDIFYHRDTVQLYSEVAIGSKQKKLLLNMKSIFSSQKTNYKFIINPLYDQFKINSEDLNYLNNLFGNENIFDYSGINEFTNDYKNYYESSHYRPHVAKNIMQVIYDEK